MPSANDTLFYRDFYERACVQGDIACSQYGSCARTPRGTGVSHGHI